MGRVLAAWVGLVSRHPLVVLALVLALAAGALRHTLVHLRFDTDTSNMLSSELAWRQNHAAFTKVFPHQVDDFLVVIDAPTALRARRAAAALAERLAEREDLFRWVQAPGAGAFFERNALLYMDRSSIEDLADRLSAVQPLLSRLAADESLRGLAVTLGEAIEAVRGGEFLDLGPVVSHLDDAVRATLEERPFRTPWREVMRGESAEASERRSFVRVQPVPDWSALQPVGPSIEAVRSVASGLGLDAAGGYRVRVTGVLALEYEEMRSVSRGAGFAALLSLVLAIGALWLAFRSLRMVFVTAATLVVGLALTAGFAVVAVGQLNLVSVAFAVLYIGLGVDFAIHLGLRWQELYRCGADPDEALRAAAADVGPSLCLCAATTAVGFYAFAPTDYVGVSELGVIAGTGVLIGLAATLTFLPALLSLAPLRPRRDGPAAPPRGAPELLARLPLHHARGIRRVAFGLGVGALLLLPFTRFDYDPLSLRDPTTESVVTFRELVAESDTPPRSLTVLVVKGAPVTARAARLAALDSVGSVVSLADFVPDAQEEKLAVVDYLELILGPTLRRADRTAPPSHAEQADALEALRSQLTELLESQPEIPWYGEARRLEASLARLLAADEARLATLEAGLFDTLSETLAFLEVALDAERVTEADLPSALVREWRGADGTRRIEVFPRDDLADADALRRFVAEVRSVAPDATGPPIVQLESGQAIVRALRRAFAGALLAIAVLLVLVLRSPRDALLVLVPLLLASLLTAAFTVVFAVPFNFANIIALPLLLGVGVDNGIHVVSRLRGSDASYAALLRSSTARGVYYSALTTAASFASLGLSAHPGTASMGWILTAGLLLSLTTTLVVLPALLAGESAWRPRATAESGRRAC